MGNGDSMSVTKSSLHLVGSPHSGDPKTVLKFTPRVTDLIHSVHSPSFGAKEGAFYFNQYRWKRDDGSLLVLQ